MDPAPIPWLLEPENPSACYLALVGPLHRPTSDPQVAAARAAIAGWGPARAILDAQWPAGYWIHPDRGYSPRHKATVWQIVFLAALGAPRTPAIDRACDYVLDHSRLPDGRFSAHKAAGGAIACLNGNLLRAFFQLGYGDPRLGQSVEALAEMVLRDRFCCRFEAHGPLPGHAAGGSPCLSGAIKALGAFARLPAAQRSLAVTQALQAGIDLLLSGDLVTGPGPQWHSFGFPPAHDSDLLEAVEVLHGLGLRRDSRLDAALALVAGKQDGAGRWALGRTPRNTWAGFGRVGQPNKWITIRALGVLENWT